MKDCNQNLWLKNWKICIDVWSWKADFLKKNLRQYLKETVFFRKLLNPNFTPVCDKKIFTWGFRSHGSCGQFLNCHPSRIDTPTFTFKANQTFLAKHWSRHQTLVVTMSLYQPVFQTLIGPPTMKVKIRIDFARGLYKQKFILVRLSYFLSPAWFYLIAENFLCTFGVSNRTVIWFLLSYNLMVGKENVI